MARGFKAILQVTISFELALWIKNEADRRQISSNDLVRAILEEEKKRYEQL